VHHTLSAAVELLRNTTFRKGRNLRYAHGLLATRVPSLNEDVARLVPALAGRARSEGGRDEREYPPQQMRIVREGFDKKIGPA
jgi:hypothetical protein